MRVAELLAPRRCLACSARADPPWCSGCEEAASRLRVTGGCRRCGAVIPGDGRTHPCWPAEVPILTTVVAYRYSGPVAATVATSKRWSAWRGWGRLGADLADAVAGRREPRPDVVTWIPASRRVARRRGADHARLLATPVGAALQRPVAATLEAGAGFRPIRDLTAARVLLVDDVLTTGATLRAGVIALRRAGAAPVRVAVLARAGGHRLG